MSGCVSPFAACVSLVAACESSGPPARRFPRLLSARSSPPPSPSQNPPPARQTRPSSRQQQQCRDDQRASAAASNRNTQQRRWTLLSRDSVYSTSDGPRPAVGSHHAPVLCAVCLLLSFFVSLSLTPRPPLITTITGFRPAAYQPAAAAASPSSATPQLATSHSLQRAASLNSTTALHTPCTFTTTNLRSTTHTARQPRHTCHQSSPHRNVRLVHSIFERLSYSVSRSRMHTS